MTGPFARTARMRVLASFLAACAALVSARGDHRVVRDIPVSLDLTDAAGVTFEFMCPDPSQVKKCAFYYRSGGGWYGNRNIEADRPGVWQRVRMPKLTRTELSPAGWGKIDAVRLSSVFRTREGASEIAIRNLAPIRGDGSVLIVRGASCGRQTPGLAKEMLDFALTFDETFASLGVTATSVDDDDLAPAHLARAKLLILPYNRDLPDGKAAFVRDYLARGGALLMCYQPTKDVLPPELEKKCRARKGPGKDGQWPEQLEEGRFVYFGHVWKGLKPSDGTPPGPTVDYFCSLIGKLDPALAERMRAAWKESLRSFADSIAAVREATRRRPGERRVMWAHSPLGPRGRPGDWEKPLRILKATGFTDLLVNVCWGYGCAYDSKVLPRAPVASDIGWEPLDACRAACRRNGIKMHAWRVCWQVFAPPRSDPEARRTLAAAGRMQVDFKGEVSHSWLCPNHPENRRMEMAAMLELALEKDVDGIHYDYFRYADDSARWCFCSRCRELFEAELGRPVGNWPGDIRKDGELARKWSAFKRKTLSGVIGPVAERVHRERPGVEISIAARPDPASARDLDGQDWPEWCRKGWLDFVCPMDYSASPAVFAGRFRAQMPLVHGVPLLPGLGYTSFPDDGREAQRFAGQVREVREAGLTGFTFYSLTGRTMDFLELLAGVAQDR